MPVSVTHSTPADGTFSASGAAAWNATHTVSGLGTLASQDANSVAITGGAIDGATVGTTTPAAGTFTTLTANSTFQAGKGSANYIQSVGAATTLEPVLSVAGSDTNVALAIKTQGTGAIDLAPGSGGVNLSNGGTVTAITRTATGSGYTSPPTWTASAPTTTGGTQASGTTTLGNTSGTTTVVNGGTGYTVNDVLTFSGGTFTVASTVTVSAVSGGVITAVTVSNAGAYSVIPTNPISVTGGTGTGATFSTTWGIIATLTIGNAGSGYVEQPTVSFSGGGGGSGAAAYATVGSGTIVRSLASSISFYTPNGEGFRVQDSATTSSAYWVAYGTSTAPVLRAVSSTSAQVATASAVPLQFVTNTSTEQFRVSHTASAVNYVQVTGSSTTNWTQISAQGNDTNISLSYFAKGSGNHIFATNNSSNSVQFRVLHTAGTIANYAAVNGAVAGSAPAFSVAGTDTNIDLALTPKGTGAVKPGPVVLAAGTASASTAPLKFTSGTNLTAAEAGALEYDGVVLYGTNDASSGRGYAPTAQIFRLAASGAAIGPAIANFFGTNSAIQFAAGGVYEIEAHLYFTKTTAGTVTVTATTSLAPVNLNGAIVTGAVGGGTAVGAANQIALFNSTATGAAFGATASLTTAVNHYMKVSMIVESNASASNLRINVTSSAGTVTPLRGSYYKVTKLPAGNSGVFVA